MKTVQQRKQEGFARLGALVRKKVPEGTSTATFATIGKKLGISGQSVYNYTQGNGGDGYMLDALIKEFSAARRFKNN